MPTPSLKLSLLNELEADVAARLVAISHATARLADTDTLTQRLADLGLHTTARGFSANGSQSGYVVCWVLATDDINAVLRTLCLADIGIDRIIGGSTSEQIEIHVSGHDVPVHVPATLAEARAAALAMGLIASAQESSDPAHLTRQAA